MTTMTADARPAAKVVIRRRTAPLGPERAGAPAKDFIDDRGSQNRAPFRDKQGAARGRNPLRKED